MNEMRTYIAGSQHHKGARDRIARLLVEEQLTLVREASNPHDRNAVAVHDVDGLKLGYVPRADAPAVAKAIDSNFPTCAFSHGGTTLLVYWEVPQNEAVL